MRLCWKGKGLSVMQPEWHGDEQTIVALLAVQEASYNNPLLSFRLSLDIKCARSPP